MRTAVAFYRKAFSGLPAGVWAFSLVLFVHRSGTMVLPFLALHLKDHLGLSSSAAAGLLSVYGLGSVCGAVAGGRLVSHYGAVRTMTLALLGVAPLFLLLLIANTAASAALAMFALSLVGDAVRPAAMTATANLCDNAILGRAFALNRLAVNLGMSIGPAIAGFLYASHYHVIFIVDAVTCVLAAALIWYLFGFGSDASPAPVDPKASRQKVASFWRDGLLLLVLSQFCLVMIVFLQTLGAYPIYLREEYQITEATIGLLFTINTGLIVAFEMVLIASLERFAKLPIIGLGAVLIVLGFGILPFGHSLSFLCFTVVVWTFGEMLSMPLLTTWVSERAPRQQRGQYMGVLTAMFSIAWIIAPALGGAAYAYGQNIIWLLALASVPIVVATFALAIRAERRNANALTPVAEGL